MTRLCQLCSSVQTTCCQQTDVLVTDGDILRVSQESGCLDFFEFRLPTDPAYLDQDDDPNWIWYTVSSDGTRRVLKHKENQACLFLGEKGCTLSMEGRPLVCRLYPLAYNETELSGVEHGCPSHLLEEGESLLSSVGIQIEDGKRWHQQLYEELRNGSVFNENRHHLRSA